MKQKYKSESGRSMVEMLGVLAVIGVLSVAGIAGYNTAMQSYRTNEILNATSMFYVLAMSQNQGNGPSGKIDYSKVGGTNPSGATLEYENNAITITFNDTKDCTMAKNKLGDKASGECPTLTVSFGEITSNMEGYKPNAESCGGGSDDIAYCQCPAGYRYAFVGEDAYCTKKTDEELFNLCEESAGIGNCLPIDVITTFKGTDNVGCQCM